MKRRINRPTNITLAPEVRETLEAKAEELGVGISKVITALVKIYCHLSIDGVAEEAVATDLKKSMNRALFMAFLQATGAAMPKSAHAVPCACDPAREPEAWTLGRTGYLAFYNPVAENKGILFTKATELKNAHRLTKVYIVAPHPPVMDADFKRDLQLLGIHVVPLADVGSTFAGPASGKRSLPLRELSEEEKAQRMKLARDQLRRSFSSPSPSAKISPRSTAR